MNAHSPAAYESPALRWAALLRLGKPKVVSLIVFTAVIGMLLAAPPLPSPALFLCATFGIGLVATAAAALNCILERRVDRLMARTRARPLPTAEVTLSEASAFAAVTGVVGLALLFVYVNPLTMWLTLATFMGYAIVYTLVLKPLTPQNIVIGGASGAMPPILGWAAATGGLAPEALLLFLIIFVWTPPHFWALALFRKHEYANAGIPMLPVTHGAGLTRDFILLYSVALLAVSVLPFATGGAGVIYLAAALVLGGIFLTHAWRLRREPRDSHAMRAFRFSIAYLALIFAALMVDHYVSIA